MPAPKTDWMHEKFTAAEKRECVKRFRRALMRQRLPAFSVDEVSRDQALLNAIIADYDFQDRQQELAL